MPNSFKCIDRLKSILKVTLEGTHKYLNPYKLTIQTYNVERLRRLPTASAALAAVKIANVLPGSGT